MDINQNNIYGNNNVNIGPQPRHLSDRIKQELISYLNKEEKIKIIVSMGDGEASIFAEEMKKYLVSEGFMVDGVIYAFTSIPMRGQSINPNLIEGYREIRIGHNL